MIAEESNFGAQDLGRGSVPDSLTTKDTKEYEERRCWFPPCAFSLRMTDGEVGIYSGFSTLSPEWQRRDSERSSTKHHQPDRSNEKERGRIESWRGPRERHGRDRVAENRSDGVAHGIRELNHGHNPRQRAQPTRAARGKRRECETKRERDEQSDQLLAKLKRWHGEPRPALSQDGHGWVINIEESGGSFVENMQCEGHCECQPRHGEAARIFKTVLVHTAPDQLSRLSF